MKRLHIIRLGLGAILFTIAHTVPAQQLASGKVAIQNKDIKRQGNQVCVKMDLNMDNLHIKSNQGLVFTPMIVNGNDTLKMPAAEILGRKRYIYYQRTHKTATSAPLIVTLRRNKEAQTVNYCYTTPYRKWMAGSQLVIGQDLCGCNQAIVEEGLFRHIGEAIPTPPKKCDPPTPKTRVERIRQMKGTVRLNFNINKAIINKDLGNNNAELDKLRKTIETVKNNSNVKITAIVLHGYASPDGNYDNNDKLALSRTKAVLEYISSLCSIDKQNIKICSTAEDWQGVRDYVEKHEVPQRQIVLDIIDSDMQPDEKEKAIAAKAGKAHRYLIDKVYPQLRRTDYLIEYEVKDISYEETKKK